MEQNKKTILCIFVAFIISFGIFAFTLNTFFNISHVSEDEKLFYSQDKTEKKKIFIIGSSQVLPINATLIDEILSKEYSEYEVYNLGKGSDLPKNRIDSLDLMINAKPTLVLYGVGFRDLAREFVGGFGSLTFTDSISQSYDNYLPSVKDNIEKQFLAKIGFFDYDLEFLTNPKYHTLSMIKSISKNSVNSEVESEPLTFSKIPFYHPTLAKITEEMKRNPDEKITNCGQHVDFDPAYKDRNIVSLRQFVDKLKEHNIKVILFSAPYHKKCLDNFPEKDKSNFKAILQEIGDNYDVSVYFLHDSYRNYDMWYDNHHLTFQNSPQYSQDIAAIISSEIRKP